MDEQEKDERRFFYGPDGVSKYFIESPTAEDIRGADWQYSKTFTQCLVEGITTTAEMMDILNRRGITGPDFEQRARELAQNLSDKIAVLNSTTDLDIKRELALETAQNREELFQWNQRLNGPLNNTAEQISDDAKLEYLTSAMVVKENGDRVWSTYPLYLKEKSQALALRARFEVMLYLQGLSPDFIDQTPEAVAMREVEQDVLQKAEQALATMDDTQSEDISEEVGVVDVAEPILEIDTEDKVSKKKSARSKK